MKAVSAAFSALLAMIYSDLRAEDFSFDASEYEKKTFEFSGYAEAKQEALDLQPERAAYTLNYPDQPPRDWLWRSTGTLDLAGTLNLTKSVANLHAQAFYATDSLISTHDYDKIMDGGIRWSPASDFSLDIGKRVQRWGKGYAWNPVGFIERPKDPSDPQTVREGFNMLSMEWTRTQEGVVRTIMFTPVLVPTYDELNPDFGKTERLNPAAKLYLLAWDTDIDLMWLAEGARPQSIGSDFSRNITTNLEVHGEWAHQYGMTQNYLLPAGGMMPQNRNTDSYLLGIRYLTEHEVTWIAEYYHNGRGYSASELDTYYRFLDAATVSDATAVQLQQARQLQQSGYGKANAGENYFYLRASVSEPFNWLYTTPALTLINHLDDNSFQITPEISYTGLPDTEIRTRAMIFSREQRTEFGEKLSRFRFEIYARYYF